MRTFVVALLFASSPAFAGDLLGPLQKEGAVLGVKPGAPVSDLPESMKAKNDWEYLLDAPTEVTLGSRPVYEVKATVVDGSVKSLEVQFGGGGEQEHAVIQKLTERLCEGLELHPLPTQSPLGSPQPGVEWDPAMQAKRVCSGERHGSSFYLRETHNYSYSQRHGNITVKAGVEAIRKPQGAKKTP